MATKTDRQRIRGEHPDSWIAVEEGDTIYGELLDVTEAWSNQRDGGSWYPLLTIGKIQECTGYDEGVYELKVHCFGSILFNEVMRHQPEVGEKVRITYKGTGQARERGLNPPELYNLRVEGRRDQAQRAYTRIQQSAPARPTPMPEPTQTVMPEDTPF